MIAFHKGLNIALKFEVMNTKISTNFVAKVKKEIEKQKKDVVKHIFSKDNIKFSFYKTMYKTNYQEITVLELVKAIKEGRTSFLYWRDTIERLRTSHNKSLKRQLPTILTSCKVSQGAGKTKENITDLLPFVQIDFDDVEKYYKDAYEAKARLIKDKYSYIVFISPSGTGIKIIAKIDTSKDFEGIYNYLEDYYLRNYDLPLDKSCKNINRQLYLSYDKDVFFNENAEVCSNTIKKMPNKTQKPHLNAFNIKSSIKHQGIVKTHIKHVLDSVKDKLLSTQKGQRHNELLKQSYLLGGYVSGDLISYVDAESFLNNIVETIFINDKDIKTEFRTVKDGLNRGQKQPITEDKIISNFENWKANFKPTEFKPTKQKDLIKFDKKYTVNNYLSEIYEDLTKEITENKRLLITAPTGTGKTYTIIEKVLPKLLEQGKRVLIALPLRSLVDGVVKDYKGQGFAPIKGGTDKEEINCAIIDGVAVATYDKALEIADYFDIIIVDEAHNFLSAYNYRNETILKLWNNSEDKNIVFITATPPKDLFKFLNFRQIKVEVKEHKPETVEIRKGYNNEIDTALTHIINDQPDGSGSIAIKINSKKKLQTLKEEIIKNGLAAEKEVIILDRNIEQRPEDYNNYTYLVDNNRFKEGIKYILSTNYINDGINIKDKKIKQVVSIETQYNPDPNEFRQFIARFRVHNNIKFVEYLKTQKEFRKKINTDIEFTKLKSNKNEIVRHLNGLIKLDLETPLQKTDVLKISKHLFYNKTTGRYIKNQISILYEVYNRFIDSLNTNEFINYLIDNYNLNIKLDNYEFIEKVKKTEHDKEKEKERKEKRELIFYNELKNNKLEVFNFVFKKTKSKKLKEDLTELENIHYNAKALEFSDETIKTFINHYSELETLVKRFLSLLKIDIPENKIIFALFTKKKDTIKKRSDIQFNLLIKRLSIDYLRINKNQFKDAISKLNIKFLYQIIGLFTPLFNVELSSSEIKEILKTVLNESLFFSIYKDRRFIDLIKILFEVEKIKIKKDVYKYKIISVKNYRQDWENVLLEIDFENTEKKTQKKVAETR